MWGVANDRLISLSDPEMRHGRKTESQRVDGYKRYIGRDLDEGQLILAVTVLAANIPEHRGADAMRPELAPHGPVTEVHIDRAFLPSELVRDVDEASDGVRAKPYSERVRHGYSKRDFTIDFDNREVTCPAGKVAPIEGELARFRRADCVPCPQRAQCQKPDTSKPRVIQLSPREPLLQKLMRRNATPDGRAMLRPRVAVEHGLAHVVFRQGDRARYFGARKNEYDLRRAAAIGNLQALDHAERLAAAA